MTDLKLDNSLFHFTEENEDREKSVNNDDSCRSLNKSAHNIENIRQLDLNIIYSIIHKLDVTETEKLIKNLKNKSIAENFFKKKQDRLCFVVGLDDGRICYWDANQCVKYKEVKAHDKNVRCCLKFNEDIIISASYDHTIKIWDLKNLNSKELRTLRGHTEFIRCLLKIDDFQFVSGSNDHTIRLWDIRKDECIRTILGSTCFVLTLIKIEDEDLWVSGTGDGNLIFWDVLTKNAPLYILEGHKFSTWTVIQLLSKKYIASGSGDGTIRIWDYKAKKCKETLQNGNTNIIGLVNCNKKVICSFSTDGIIRFWNLEKRDVLKKVQAFENSMIICHSKLINDRLILVGGSNHEVKLFDFKSKKQNYFILKYKNTNTIRSIEIIENIKLEKPEKEGKEGKEKEKEKEKKLKKDAEAPKSKKK